MEVAGELLQILRAKQEGLRRIAGQRQTVADLCGRLIAARQMLHARFAEPLRNVEVAGEAALSEYHFSRLFRTAFEKSVPHYLRDLRLDEARRLLRYGGLNVTDAAMEVGYTSLSSFTHAFVARFGCTPGAMSGGNSRIRQVDQQLAV